MYGFGGNSALQPHSMGEVMGGRRGTRTGTHTGTYTQMLHLPLSDLPLKKCPKNDLPASLVTGKAPGGTCRKFRGVRAEVSGRGPRLLRSRLGVEISRRKPSEANF